MDIQANTTDTGEKSSNTFERISSLIFTAFVFLLPIFFVPYVAVPFALGKGAFVSIVALALFISWIVARLKYGSFGVPITPVLLLGLALPLVYLISALFTPSFMTSIIGQGFEVDTVVSMAVLFLLLFLVPSIFRSKQSVFNLYLAVFISFLVVALFQILRFFFGAGFFSFNIFTTTVSNLVGSFNDLSVFAGLIAVLALFMLEIVPTRGMLKVLLYASLALALVFLAIVNFNTAWYVVGFFALTLFIYMISFAKLFNTTVPESPAKNLVARLPRTPLAVVIITIIFIFFGSSIGNAISTKLNISQLEARPSWQSTIEIAGKVLAKSPLIGAGPNNFSREWNLYKPQPVNESLFWNIDFNFGIGLIPTAFITTGVLGGLVWVLFILSLLYEGVRALKKPREDVFAYYLTLTSFAGTLYLWVMSILYTPTIVVYSLAFIFSGIFVATLVLGGSIKESRLNFTKEPSVRFVSVLILILFLIASATGVYLVGQKAVSASLFNNALIAYNTRQDLEGAEKNVRLALQINGADLYYRGLSELALINLNRVASQITPQTPPDFIRTQFQTLLGGAIESARNAVNVDKQNYLNYLSLGRAYESVVPLKIAGAYENAKASYDEAVRLNPTSPQMELTLARLELLNANNKGAKDNIAKALKLKNNYTEAIFLLSQIEVSEGNIKGAISSVESASVLAPTDPVVFFQLGFLRYNNRDYTGAIQALERAVTLEPSYANAKYFLGLSYDKIGRTKDAITQFEQIQITNPDNQEVKFILGNLHAGKSPFASVTPPLDDKPEKRKKLPVPEEAPKVNEL